MTSTATKSASIRVLALGRTRAAQTLSLDPRAEVFAAADELTAIGELGSLAIPDAPTLILISERARRMDSLPDTIAALRTLDPDARFVAVMEGRQRIEPIPGIDAWVHADDSADTLINAATPPPTRPTDATGAPRPFAPEPRPMPTSPPARQDQAVPARGPAIPPAAPPQVAGASSTSANESAVLDAITHGRDPLPELLDHISARVGAGSLRFVDRAESPERPRTATGEHAAPVTTGNDTAPIGWLVGPSCIADALTTEAATLARWLTTRAQLEQLRREAYTDHLTGAWNRRYFERFANSIFQNASAIRRPVTILLFDIDDFKHYNDAYGHEAGDDILRETVRLLNSTVRADDRVCRVGGDEFAVVFNEPTGPRDASSQHPTSIFDVAARFRRLLCDCRFRHLGETVHGKLTISGGLATYPWDGTTLEDLVRRADHLILESKRQGKNVICYGQGCCIPQGTDTPAPTPPDNA